MYFFNIKTFTKFTFRALFRRDQSRFQISPIRWILVLLFFIGYFLFELFTWLCFSLDEILFPKYRQEADVEKSVFIVGNPRSGTTFLQRILAQDVANFTAMKTWEILFAPSILQRRMIFMLMRLDHTLGCPGARIIQKLETYLKENNKLHRIEITAPEEDQYLFLHTWSTISLWVFGGMVDEVDAYLYFDQQMPENLKNRIMSYYKGCIKRHLYMQRKDTDQPIRYLSKNPSASPKIGSLLEQFTDPKIIYLVRNPLEMIPSYISMLDFTWELGGEVTTEYGGRDFVLEMAKHWYTYPLQRLEDARDNQYIIVNFEDLVSHPKKTISAIYSRFDLSIHPAFNQILIQVTENNQDYQSSHQYSLSDMGLEKKEILSQFQDIFDQFQFDHS